MAATDARILEPLNRPTTPIGTIVETPDIGKSESLHCVSEEENLKKNLTIRLCKTLQMSIYRPLIPLKLTQFFWNGGLACIRPYLAVHLKQLGMTISEISFIYMLLPVVQILTATLSGVIADKTGRPKAVLLTKVLMAIAFLVCIMLLPRISEPECNRFQLHLRCPQRDFEERITGCEVDKSSRNESTFLVEMSETSGHAAGISRATSTDFLSINDSLANTTIITRETLKTNSTVENISTLSVWKTCVEDLSEKITYYPVESSFVCDILFGQQLLNTSSSFKDNIPYIPGNECFDISDFSIQGNYTMCVDNDGTNCSIACVSFNKSGCSSGESSRTSLLIMASITVVAFITTYSNCYRFLDLTAMHLTKGLDKDYGRERIAAVGGIIFFSLLSGYVVNAAADEKTNYKPAFYICIFLQLAATASIWKLEVHLNPPGQKMWKKSITLLRDPHTAVFGLLVAFVLGTTFCFCTHFLSLYLVELEAPSYLLSAIWAVAGLYGLPFLYTSNWWLRKLGCHNLFLLAFLGYTVQCFGLSLIRDPWWAVALQATDIFNYHLLMVAVVTHSHAIAPEGLKATVIATVGTIFHGIGKSSASLVGGQVMAAYGSRIAFRVLGTMCLASGLLYFFYLSACRWKQRASRTRSNKNRVEKVLSDSSETAKLQSENVQTSTAII